MFALRDGMRIGFDVEVPTTDGTILRADVYLPDTDEPAPVIMTMGPTAKVAASKTSPTPAAGNASPTTTPRFSPTRRAPT